MAKVIMCLLVASMVGCAKPPPIESPPIESPRLVALEVKIAVLTDRLATLQAWSAKQAEAQKATSDLAEALAKQALKPKAKPTGGGWVDCWTDNKGHRNCVDAAGNTSSRNF